MPNQGRTCHAKTNTEEVTNVDGLPLRALPSARLFRHYGIGFGALWRGPFPNSGRFGYDPDQCESPGIRGFRGFQSESL
jgi:hypothetical protein